MKTAVWRYGLPFQLDGDSSVGGGLLSEALLRHARAISGEVVLVGRVSPGTVARVEALGVRVAPGLADLSGFDAALIATGPFNPLYGDSAFETYKLLAAFRGRVAYAQWDHALPFHFAPSTKLGGMPEAVARIWEGKRWHILTQTPVSSLRNTRNRSTGYATAPFRHVPCCWELEEAARTPLPICPAPRPALAYFGSDRPGRLAEVQRLLCGPSAPPVHLYGRWSEESLKVLTRNVQYMGPVPERDVTTTLNQYMATVFITDQLYCDQNYVTQRFFENATASVPVLYSDNLPATIRSVAPNQVRNSVDVARAFQALFTADTRLAYTQANAAAATRVRSMCAHSEPSAAIRTALVV